MTTETAQRDYERNCDRFAILLSTYNGEDFLEAQIETLARQTVDHIDIWLSDDGSTDKTLTLARKLAAAWRKGAFNILEGPRAGFAENFRSLVCRDDIFADFVAFCDQDDLWDTDKLEIARQFLNENPLETPGLYCGRTRTVDRAGHLIGHSPLMERRPSFLNALVQSIAGANTMVMNRAAFELVRDASSRVTFVSHDWWCYLLVSGADGKVTYDPIPRVSYRQHGKNVVGSNTGVAATVARYKLLLSGRFSDWNETNVRALQANLDFLSPENSGVLLDFAEARTHGRFRVLRTIFHNRLHRQSVLGNVNLIAGTLLGKI